MTLTERERELVAIGASIGGNCIPCLEKHYNKGIEAGISRGEMQEAFYMAKRVKETPNRIIDETADRLNGGDFMRTMKIDRSATCIPADTGTPTKDCAPRKDCRSEEK